MNWFLGVLIDFAQIALIAWLLMLLAPVWAGVLVGYGAAIILTAIVYVPATFFAGVWSALTGP